MLIRSFQLSDVNQVMDLLQVSLSEACYEDTKQAFARQLAWDSELILVAEAEEEIQGVLIGTIDQHTGCIYRMAVHPDYRRRGVGRSLVSAMEQRFSSAMSAGSWWPETSITKRLCRCTKRWATAQANF
ncbi:hypothetical protein HMSSN036_94550 [Paenibacillus macerans]|nr:hypothetical protein HMSSN036_94550 [Paenibacillus macerans]